MRLRHSGPTQSPLRTAFPIIILHQNFGGSNHHCVSALASGLHGRGDELHAGSLGCMVSGQLGRCYNQLHLMRSDDYGSWFSYLGRGMRAFFSAQGPGRSSKCSAEVLDRQLVSAVLRSSVG